MIPPLAPKFDAALRDVRAQHPRFRAASAARLAEPPEGRRDEAIEGLLELARDRDGAVRAAAFESLGILEAREAVVALTDGFRDSHQGARQAAVVALGRVAPERAASSIVELLDDPRPEMRFAAVWTLAGLGESHAPAIARALHDSDAEVRALAADCLGNLGAVGLADAVAALLDDRADPVRFAAASALAALGDLRGAPRLREALRRTDRAFAAAIGLGDLEDEHAHAELLRLAKRRWRSPIVRAAAARALVRLGDPEGTTVIRTLVRSWRIEARQYAVELVGELQLTALIPDVAIAFRRSRRRERAVYEASLERLASKSAQARALLASMRGVDHSV